MKTKNMDRLVPMIRLTPAASVLLLALLSLMFALPACAASSNIIESEIEGAPGFRFENLMFGPDHITFNIVNMTDKNARFAASITFVDINGRVAAEVDLLPMLIPADSRASYKSFFVTGSPETARRSDKILWRPQVTMQSIHF